MSNNNIAEISEARHCCKISFPGQVTDEDALPKIFKQHLRSIENRETYSILSLNLSISDLKKREKEISKVQEKLENSESFTFPQYTIGFGHRFEQKLDCCFAVSAVFFNQLGYLDKRLLQAVAEETEITSGQVCLANGNSWPAIFFEIVEPSEIQRGIDVLTESWDLFLRRIDEAVAFLSGETSSRPLPDDF